MSFLKNNLRLHLAIVFIGVFLISCSSSKRIQRTIVKEHKYDSHFKSFVLYNPVTKKELININGKKYFTPASNTKLYTFYTAYKALGDSIKSFEYTQINDSLILKGTADPTLFYGFDSTKVVNFLTKDTLKVFVVDARIDEPVYGTGWTWDDYAYYYMPEKSLFPIHGNVLEYQLKNDSLLSFPSLFKDSISVIDTLDVIRKLSKNQFFIEELRKRSRTVPFITSNAIFAEILGTTIHKNVAIIQDKKHYQFKPFYNVSKDSVLKQMMVVSDNFIAEQLLLQVAKKTTNTYSTDSAIVYSLKNYLKDLPQEPRWVDGSGISRYNLFSPNDMVFLLDKMYNEIPQQQLFNYFPIGGKSGTLKNWYKGEKSYVYAKSGTLSNNYSLSGYLVTKSGKILIFSAMNNHFKIPLKKIKEQLAKDLFKIYAEY